MKYSILMVAFFVIIGVNGCGYKEGVVTTEQKSYLYFTGNIKDVKVIVDNGEGFAVESGKDHQYKIASGKHTVTVYRNDIIILKREIFVSDGITKEIEVQP